MEKDFKIQETEELLLQRRQVEALERISKDLHTIVVFNATLSLFGKVGGQ